MSAIDRAMASDGTEVDRLRAAVAAVRALHWQKPPLSVTATEWVDIKGRGPLAIVSADQIPTMPKLWDSLIIDGSPYVVTAIERQPTNPPRYIVNGHYCLLVRPA
jgi:hypothetical protein